MSFLMVKKVHFFLFLIGILFYGVNGSTKATEIELMHFWISPSEKAALNVFSEDFKKRGGQWKEDSYENYQALKQHSLERIVDGIAPSALQWTTSSSLQDLFSSGLVLSYDLDNLPDGFANVFPSLIELVSLDSKVMAIPVTMHGENWAFYNKDIMDELNLKIPINWDNFFNQMEFIEQAGYKTIAMSEQFWEFYVVFKTMLASAGKVALIQGIREGKLTVAMEEQLEIAIANIIKFREIYNRSGYKSVSWSDASEAVISDKAAVQFMGDWAKGEMISKGAIPNEDFICAMAPGNEDIYLYGVDIFVLPEPENESAKLGQSLFVDVILDPQNQVNFANLKGSISVLSDTEKSDLDACAQLAFSIIHEGGVSEFNSLVGGRDAEPFTDALSTVVSEIWKGEITDVQLAMKRIKAMEAQIRGF